MSIFLPSSIIKNDGCVTVVKNMTSYLNEFIKPKLSAKQVFFILPVIDFIFQEFGSGQ